MGKRKLGNSDIEIAPLAFGGNVFGWTADETTSFALLDAFVDAGFSFIDTADSYSHWAPGNQGGESETVIGKWLKRSGQRDNVIIATKVGSKMGPDRQGLSKSYILHEVEDSLRRLQTDFIDLYQSHIDDTNTPLEETLDAYDHLVKQGKVRVIGASNYTAGRLAQALEISQTHGYPRYESLQPLYNLYDRNAFEKKLAPICRERNVGVITYFSLASGFLSGKYRSVDDLASRARARMVEKYVNARGLRILEALDTVARRYEATPAAIALAWLIAQPAVTAPIASATNLAQFQELVNATTIELDEASLDRLNSASAEED